MGPCFVAELSGCYDGLIHIDSELGAPTRGAAQISTGAMHLCLSHAPQELRLRGATYKAKTGPVGQDSP